MYVNEVGFIALSEVVDHRGLVEVGEVCHVVGEIELWRVDLVDCVAADCAVDGVVVAADEQRRPSVLDNPSLDKGVVLVVEPDPAPAGEFGHVAGIIRAATALAVAGAVAGVVDYELWGECAGGRPADMEPRGNGAGHGCCWTNAPTAAILGKRVVCGSIWLAGDMRLYPSTANVAVKSATVPAGERWAWRRWKRRKRCDGGHEIAGGDC